MRRALALGLIVVLAASVLRFSVRQEAEAADTIDPAFVDQVVATGLVLPTSMARLPDGRVLIAEKAGRVRVFKNGQILATPFLDYRGVVNEALDRGLTSVTVGPDFATTGYVYLTFVHDYNASDSSSPTTGRVVRVTASGDVMLPNSEVVILGSVTGAGCASQTSATCVDEAFPAHTIDQVTVATDGTLWVSLGDAADFDNPSQLSLRAQNLDSYRGKLLHIAANGDGLTTNPFYTNSVTTVRSKVHAYGFRNPFRFAINPANGVPYVGDVGWGTQEEINVATPGANFGWPCYEGASQQSTWQSDPACQTLYSQQGTNPVKAPLLTYPHNGFGASVVMGQFTPASTTFATQFRNGFFYADYAQDWIRFQPVTASNTTNGSPIPVATGLGGPVDFEFFPDGNLYFLTILSGELRRLAPVTGGGTTQYLSDLATVGSPVNGFGPFERDRANGEAAAGDGAPLRIAGVSYTKGLGMHAAADVSFAVPSGCTSFLASVGIDDEVGTDPGDVVFEVWNGTSSRLYQSPLKSVGQAATAVNVSVSGVSTLRLVVTAGGDNNWFDHADWGNARFSCAGGGGGDVTAPAITAVGSAVTSTSATITWTTDEGSSSQVEWGTTTGYGNSTVLDNTLVTSHGQSIGGLLAATLYHYRVRSIDAAGNVGVSGDNVFMTSGSGGGATQYLSDLPTTGTPVNGYGPFERDLANGEAAAGDGAPLRIAGVTYTKGLGVHAASELSFAVPSGCTAFDASVGIDDEIGTDPGDVVFEVWNGTTTRLYQSPLKSVGQAATAVNVSLTGVSTLRLVVTAGADNNWFDHADWGNARFTCSGGTGNAAPVPVISAPSASYKYKVGDTIAFTGSASDPEDGPLATSQLNWNVLLKHCPGGACHVHPSLSYTGAGSSFVVPDHGDDSYFEIVLSATDSQGLSGSTTLRLDPMTVQINLQSSPSGLQLIYSDVTVTTPVSITTVVNSQHLLQAPSPQGNATFASWSDGGAQNHTITMGTAAATYTANYTTTGGGSTQYVSDLATVGSPVNGFGPFERDRSNGEGAAGDGAPLRVGGVTYTKGLGVHAASDLSFAVPSGCTSFQASVGIDDEVGTDPGDVVFEVWNGTTTRLYQSPLKSVGQAATAVNVSMSGVSALRLVVTAGGDNNWFDHADWGNARFTCSGGGGGDTTPPVVSAVGSTVTATSATVNWTTNEPATTQVEYGLTTGYGTTTTVDTTLLTSHSQVLSGLTAATTYNYRVRSADAAGNSTTSGNFTFTTSAGTGGGSTQYLSDLPTTGTPVNGFGPFERDRANGNEPAGDGAPLRIAGVSYTKGLGVHAASDLSFAVPSGCTAFDASVGIDDEVGTDPGDVVFEVWNGTTTRLYQSPLKAVGQAATAVNVSVSGVSTLRLVVTAGGDNNWFDHADWGNARFTCSGGGGGDTTPPVISAVGATVTATAATVSWTTNEASSTQIEYGLTTGYGNTTTLVPALVTAHSQGISGLTAATTYNYRVRSTDAAGNTATSGNFTFTTSSGGGGPVFGNATSYTAGTQAHASTIADFNGDGIADVATANAGSDTVAVRLGTGGGALGAATSFAVADQPKSVATGDFNNDGRIDLVTANQGSGTSNVSVLLGNGNGTFATRVDYAAAPNSHEVAVGDLNADGRPDLAVVGWGGSVVSILPGNANGTFGAKSDITVGSAPHSVVIADLNGDGRPDIATANNGSGNVSVVLRNANGTWAASTSYATGSGPHSIRAGNLTGDARPELVVANDGSSNISVLPNNGNGTFAAAVNYATTATPKSVAVVDVNGDGRLDVLASSIAGNYPSVVNPGADRVALFLGNSNGTLGARTDYAAGSGAFSVVVGDLNGDGRPDMVVSTWHANGIQVRLNQS